MFKLPSSALNLTIKDLPVAKAWLRNLAN